MDTTPDTFIASLSAALAHAGLADEAALSRARRAQAKTGERFDRVLTELGIVPERALAAEIARVLGLPLAEATAFPDTALLTDTLPTDFLARARLMPIALDAGRLTLAMADPFNDDAVRSIGYLTGLEIDRAVAAASDFEAAFARLYGLPQTSARLDGDPQTSDASDADDVERLKDIASEAPVIRFVADMIARAVERRASDIHVEPQEDHLRVRFRRDGRLEQTESLPRAMHAAVTSRLKIMARLLGASMPGGPTFRMVLPLMRMSAGSGSLSGPPSTSPPRMICKRLLHCVPRDCGTIGVASYPSTHLFLEDPAMIPRERSLFSHCRSPAAAIAEWGSHRPVADRQSRGLGYGAADGTAGVAGPDGTGFAP